LVQEDGERRSELLTLSQLAKYLGMAERTIYVWAQQGKIPAFKVGTAWRFRRSDIDSWLETQRSGPSFGGQAPLTDPPQQPSTSWRIRRQDEQAHEALVAACRAFIESTMLVEDRSVFVIEQFVDRFGRDVVDAVVEQLRKEKLVVIDEEKGLDGEMVKVIRKRRL
jgi:excisionase family DNA binding protein